MERSNYLVPNSVLRKIIEEMEEELKNANREIKKLNADKIKLEAEIKDQKEEN
jgi:phage shock protein A